MEFKTGDKFYNESDERTRVILSIQRMKGNIVLIQLHCIDCSVKQKDHYIESEELEAKIEKHIFEKLEEEKVQGDSGNQ